MFQRLDELFHSALAIPDPQARRTFLSSLTGPDAELVPRLEALLEADLAAAPPAQEPVSPHMPRFGPYRAERVIGRGGMGVVYLARRDDGQFEQVVAVKAIAAAMDPEQGIPRFLRERQILARLRHPGIARMLDGGVGGDGSPYLVMEHVEGEPLDRWCTAHKLSVPARIELMRKVCQAAAYAHRNLVIHRDLKPSNILVSAEGEPKLLDFGTARTLGEGLTMTGRMLTPRYASPELLRQDAAGTAADVFSAGVMLAEILTGRWPYGDPASQRDLLRRVAEEADPAPLEHLATAEHASTLGLTKERLQADLAGDLSAIVARCLEHDPERRYRTMEELDEDLRRYLVSEPVSARAQTGWYRLGKLVRRHRWRAVAATMASAAVLGAAGIAIWQAREARAATHRAERRFEEVRKLARMVLFDFHDRIARVPGGMEIQEEFIRQTLGQFELLAKESGGDPEILAELGEGYNRLGNLLGNPYLNNKGDQARASETYRKGIALLGGAQGTAASLDIALGHLHRSLGRVLYLKDRAASVRQLELALQHQEWAARAMPSLETRREPVNTRSSIADSVFDADPKRALGIYLETAAATDALERDFPEHHANGILFYKIGACHELLGDMRRAVEFYERGLAKWDRLPEKARTATDNLRARASLLSILGSGLHSLGRSAEAIPRVEESVAIARKLLEADPKNNRARASVGINMVNRNAAYREAGLRDKLLQGLLEEEQAWAAVLEQTSNPLYTAAAATNFDALSRAFAERGDMVRATGYATRAFASFEKIAAASPNTDDHTRYAAALLESGVAALRNPRKALEQTVAGMKASPNPPVPLRRLHGLALLRNGRKKEALAVLEECLKSAPGGKGEAELRAWIAEARR